MLNNFDTTDFLKHYWQQKPLLIRNALPGFSSPLSPDELAGLACEDGIESRIVIEQQGQWQPENGPFPEQRFAELPEQNWSLLIQAIDHYIPETAALMEHFRFIPNWRFDDIMASYAAKGGNVAPHYDNYDVFIIQAAGKREWKIGQNCHFESPLRDNPQMRILEQFEETDSWVLEAGDILYIPPLCAHWGISLDDDCISYSIGYRAPSHCELLANFCDEQLSLLNDTQRYTDAKLPLQENRGEIKPFVINKIKDILNEKIQDENFLLEWFGCYVTEPKYPQETTTETTYNAEELQQELEQVTTIYRDPAARFSYSSKDKNTAILFVNGESYSCELPLAQTLAGDSSYSSATIQQALTKDEVSSRLLMQLFNQGSLFIDDSDNDQVC